MKAHWIPRLVVVAILAPFVGAALPSRAAPAPPEGDGGVRIALRVLDPDGHPVSNRPALLHATGQFISFSNSEDVRASTAPDGTLRTVLPGALLLQVVSRIEMVVQVPHVGIGVAEIQSNDPTPTPVHLESGSDVEGVVRNEKGEPEAGVSVTANATGSRFHDLALSATTDADGEFNFPEMCQGDCGLLAQTHAGRMYSCNIHVGAKPARVVIEPDIPGVRNAGWGTPEKPPIRIQILGPDGRPVVWRTTYLTMCLSRDTGTTQQSYRVQTSSRFGAAWVECPQWYIGGLDDTPPGADVSETVIVRCPGVGIGYGIVSTGHHQEPSVRLHPGCNLTGLVLDSAGKPAENVEITAYPVTASGEVSAANFAQVLSDVHGRFAMPELERGTYLLTSRYLDLAFRYHLVKAAQTGVWVMMSRDDPATAPPGAAAGKVPEDRSPLDRMPLLRPPLF